MLLLLLILGSAESFYIISTRSDISTLSQFIPQTLTKFPISTLAIQGYPLRCTDGKYGTLLTTLVINGTITDNLYNISHRGIITGFKAYSTLIATVVDRHGHIYGITIIDTRFCIVEIGYPDKIRYTASHRDWFDFLVYHNGFFYLGVNIVRGWIPHIIVLDHWKVVRNYSISQQYRVWSMIPCNKTLYVMATGTCYIELFAINLVTSKQTTIAIYNNSASYYDRIDAVTTSVLRNHSIYSVMNNIPTQKQYLVVTDLLTSKYTIQDIPFDDKIKCIYS
jgi:hypothetical protein